MDVALNIGNHYSRVQSSKKLYDTIVANFEDISKACIILGSFASYLAMDCSNRPMHDFMNANSGHSHLASSISDKHNSPPLKRMRHSLSSSLDMNDNSSMEYDSNADRFLEYRTDQRLEYQTETSILSQDMMTCSSTCTSFISPRSNLEGSANLLVSQAIVQTDGNYDNKSMRHKRRLMNVGSNTFGSCSTNISQSSTLTELSLMEDDHIVLIDDAHQDLCPPDFVSGELYSEEIDFGDCRYNKTDSFDEIDDTMLIDSLVSNWDQNFLLHAPTLYHTNRRTKAQVQLAKRSITQIHFKA